SAVNWITPTASIGGGVGKGGVVGGKPPPVQGTPPKRTASCMTPPPLFPDPYVPGHHLFTPEAKRPLLVASRHLPQHGQHRLLAAPGFEFLPHGTGAWH